MKSYRVTGKILLPVRTIVFADDEDEAIEIAHGRQITFDELDCLEEEELFVDDLIECEFVDFIAEENLDVDDEDY